MKNFLIGRMLCGTNVIFMMVVFLLTATSGTIYEVAFANEASSFCVLLPPPPPPPPPMPVEIPQVLYENCEDTDEPEYEIINIVYVQVLQGMIPSARCYFKSWMDWRSITYRNSRQWRMQQIAYTCGYGFRRVDGLYMIALGTYFLYHGVGDVFDITLSSDITFRAVVGDVKCDRHTDPTNRFHRSDGSVVEFIVDRRVMCRSVLSMGNISFAGFPGEVVSIKRLPELFIEV